MLITKRACIDIEYAGWELASVSLINVLEPTLYSEYILTQIMKVVVSGGLQASSSIKSLMAGWFLFRAYSTSTSKIVVLQVVDE